VAARESATLASRVPARVMALPFREGERVTRGAVVARLDDAALRSAEVAAEASVKAAEADLARIQTLVSKRAATPRELDEAMARAAAAGAALSSVRDNVSYAVLRAPFDGVVTARPARVGDVVSPGTPLVDVEGQAGLEIRASLDAAEVNRLRLDQAIQAEVDGQPAALPARVRAISSAADPMTHRAEVRADLPPASGVRSGLFARLLIPGPAGQGRITVPTSAIVQRGGLAGVFVIERDRARLRWVAIGEVEGERTEVRAGLEPDALLVVDASGLADGDSVEVIQ
jgi:RND family efflux transporter MFP subunit